jgi:hypothetical protein
MVVPVKARHCKDSLQVTTLADTFTSHDLFVALLSLEPIQYFISSINYK